MSRQLAFDLPLKQAQGREDFFVAPANALALATLDAPQGWPGRRMLLIGPEGAGKSHLAQIWADAEGALLLAATDLAEADIPTLATRAVVLEDAEALAGNPDAEEALFHLYNLAQAEGGTLLLTARMPPRDWGIVLPDLASRMQALASVKISPPDDALLAAVLVKLFNDRQLTVAPQLIDWLVTRMDRSLATARRLVAALDARALAEGRKISRQLAGEVLDSLD
ncbi:DnaA ATPase domain-containing protein [Pseudothioclava arenosa]|uniref:Chromosomal replication initiator DnaA n=1 Tax=Pseudothioclava arenosa TaxID=1795308 RepID=A0A2A4CSC8_9RHOB|nr:DnaA/Hda family protein [Pseudothioclava arenosa]PCD77505.1 chromosomal replication initiator DnaA [Pseudothioclava arenosa]